MLALLERESFEQIAVRDIAAEAGVSHATYYRHHPDKESLLNEVATDEIRHLVGMTLAIRNEDDYRAGTRALCAYVADHRSLWSTLLNGGAGAAMREEWVRQSMKVAASEEPENSWLPPDLGTICAATLIAETLSWWLDQPKQAYSVDQVTDILLRLIVSSVMAPD